MSTEQTWFTLPEAAEYLRLTPASLRKHVERGNLKPDSGQRANKPGPKLQHRFRRETLDAFITGATNDQ